MIITLIDAFNLLSIKDEMIYFRNYKDNISYGLWSEDIRKYCDMKKIRVIKIEKHFHYSFDDEKQYEFLVNLSRNEIQFIETKINKKKYKI